MNDGRLFVSKSGKLMVRGQGKKGKELPIEVDIASSASFVADAVREGRIRILQDVRVAWERHRGKAKVLRNLSPVGDLTPPRRGDAAAASRAHPQSVVQRRGGSGEEDRFHNPYNFVPALPRAHLSREQGGLGDHCPVGHDRYHQSLYTGRLRVRMTVKTPLLVVDAARARPWSADARHQIYPVRVHGEGRPYIAPTAIKGMLRAAYEAVTNSRFGVFTEHDRQLAYRPPATAELVPARVSDDGNWLELLPGTETIRRGKVSNPVMYAAWLPMYDKHDGPEPNRALRYPNGRLPRHGDEVICEVRRMQHYRARKDGKAVRDFQYWRVVSIVPASKGASPARGAEPAHPATKHGKTWSVPLKDVRTIRGWVCITNKNIDQKHDERVFFAVNGPIRVPLGQAREMYRALIENYQEIHRDEIEAGEDRPPSLERSVWSRHIVGGREECELKPGALCYARVNQAGEGWEVLGVYPVSISRELYPEAPASFLDDSLRPPTSLQALSPADRLFGWVNQDGHGSYRGHLRIGPVRCLSNAAIEPLDELSQDGLPLAVLGQPKPQQARFYLAADKQGTPQKAGLLKDEAGYRDSSEKGLRGRKAYPHQNVPRDYWDRPLEDRTGRLREGWFQEYRRPTGQTRGARERDSQNRSILGWVRPGVVFEFDIYVANLSAIELGALLWLLTLPEDHYHRFGGGKPLGFGSVRLELKRSQTVIVDGKQIAEAYANLSDWDRSLEDEVGDLISRCVRQYKDAVGRDFGEGAFERVRFIRAFMVACRGFQDGLRVHYPRARMRQEGRDERAPHPEGRAYAWFVENERHSTKQGQGGPKCSLPALWDEQGLPYLRARPR